MSASSSRTPARADTPLKAALRLLARRPYSVAEMRNALARKFQRSAALEESIAQLRAAGYLDDRKVAEQLAASLARNRAFGPARIRRELKARLFNYEFIESAIERAFQEISESDLLERALEKKTRSLRPPVTSSKLHSLCQSLVRRGFRPGDIIKAVRQRPELRLAGEEPNLTNVEEEAG